MVAILYSSNLLGHYEMCACAVEPLGGLARRAAEIDRARAEADAVLVVDAGDLFLPEARALGSTPDDPPSTEVARRARLFAAAYRQGGASALLPGERDLAMGVPRLRRVAGEAELPLVASNLYDRNGKLLFEPDRLVQAAGVPIGIFGISTPPAEADARAWREAGVDARDPVAHARDEVARLRARGARLVVALLHVGSAADSRKLLRAVPGIDWAVLGHSGMQTDPPEREGSARLLEALREGKELGRLDLHVLGNDLTFTDARERARVEAILADHRRQLSDYDRVASGEPLEAARAYDEGRREQLRGAIARETALLDRLPARITGSWFDNRIIPLDPKTPENPSIARLVDGYNREGARLQAAHKPVWLGELARESARPATGASPRR